jgi:hypothetical protein
MVRSFVHGNRTECDVSECDLETSTVRMARTTGAVESRKKKCKIFLATSSVSYYLLLLTHKNGFGLVSGCTGGT